jgi:hypothetical protein
MTLSNHWRHSATQAVSDDMGLLLVTVQHPQLLEPLRIVSDTSSVTSRGNVFEGFPCFIALPGQDERGVPGRLMIANTGNDIGKTLRLIPPRARIDVTLEYVSRDDPNIVEFEWDGLSMRNITVNDLSISCEIVGYGVEGQIWPVPAATPDITPGLFVS